MQQRTSENRRQAVVSFGQGPARSAGTATFFGNGTELDTENSWLTYCILLTDGEGGNEVNAVR